MSMLNDPQGWTVGPSNPPDRLPDTPSPISQCKCPGSDVAADEPMSDETADKVGPVQPSNPLDALRQAHRGDPLDFVVDVDPDAVRHALVHRLTGARPGWHAEAACRGEDLSVFFPVRGDSSKPAKAICERCPVRTECLEEALADLELDFGVRGGMSARERKALRTARNQTGGRDATS